MPKPTAPRRIPRIKAHDLIRGGFYYRIRNRTKIGWSDKRWSKQLWLWNWSKWLCPDWAINNKDKKKSHSTSHCFSIFTERDIICYVRENVKRIYYWRNDFLKNVVCLHKMFLDWGRRLGGQDLKTDGVLPPCITWQWYVPTTEIRSDSCTASKIQTSISPSWKNRYYVSKFDTSIGKTTIPILRIR